MTRIGQETSFNWLLAHGNNPDLQEKFAALEPKSVLDIGCSHGEALYLLYHCYDSLEHLEGFEVSPEAEVLHNRKESDKILNPGLQYDTLFARYREVTKSMTGSRERVADEAEYKRRIQVRFGTDALTAESYLPKYDVIILSNIIHYYQADLAQKLLQRVDQWRTAKSLIYIHLRSRSKQTFEQDLGFMQLEVLCRDAMKRWGLDVLRWKTEDCDLHVTFTNMAQVR